MHDKHHAKVGSFTSFFNEAFKTAKPRNPAEQIPAAKTSDEFEAESEVSNKLNHNRYSNLLSSWVTGSADSDSRQVKQTKPMMILGPSGIGKTVGLNKGVSAAAEKLGKTYIKVDARALGSFEHFKNEVQQELINNGLKLTFGHESSNDNEVTPEDLIITVSVRGSDMSPVYFLGVPSSEADKTELKVEAPGVLRYILQARKALERADNPKLRDGVLREAKKDKGIVQKAKDFIGGMGEENLKEIDTRTKEIARKEPNIGEEEFTRDDDGRRLLNRAHKLIFFFDEFTRIDPAIQNYVMQLFEPGEGYDPERTIFIGAGNYGKGFEETTYFPTDVAILDRLDIKELLHDPDIWLDYAEGSGAISKLVLDFIKNDKYQPKWDTAGVDKDGSQQVDIENVTSLDKKYHGKTYALGALASSTGGSDKRFELALTPRNVERIGKVLKPFDDKPGELLQDVDGQPKIEELLEGDTLLGSVPIAWLSSFKQFLQDHPKTVTAINQGGALTDEFKEMLHARVERIFKAVDDKIKTIPPDQDIGDTHDKWVEWIDQRDTEGVLGDQYNKFIRLFTEDPEGRTRLQMQNNSMAVDHAASIVQTLVDSETLKSAIERVTRQPLPYDTSMDPAKVEGSEFPKIEQRLTDFFNGLQFLTWFITAMDAPLDDPVLKAAGVTQIIGYKGGTVGKEANVSLKVLRDKVCKIVGDTIKQMVSHAKSSQINEIYTNIYRLMIGENNNPITMLGVLRDNILQMVKVFDHAIKCITVSDQDIDALEDETKEREDSAPSEIPWDGGSWSGFNPIPGTGKPVSGNDLTTATQKEIQRDLRVGTWVVAAMELYKRYGQEEPAALRVLVQVKDLPDAQGNMPVYIPHGSVKTINVTDITSNVYSAASVSEAIRESKPDVFAGMSPDDKQTIVDRVQRLSGENAAQRVGAVLKNVHNSIADRVNYTQMEDQDDNRLFSLIHGHEGS